MRVATNAYTDAMLQQFSTLADRQFNLQNQVSTGLRVQSASDDPTAMQNTLGYLADTATQKQYGANIATLQSRATVIDGVLQSLQQNVTDASTAAINGANTLNAATSSSSTSSITDYVKQVNDIINQVVAAANTKDPSTGLYLFGGTASSTPPFTATKDASGNVTAVTYNGNTETNQSQIGDNQTASVDVPGANTGTSGARGLITDQSSGADFLNHLISLRNDLQAGDADAVKNVDSANLQKDENNIAYQVANNGVAQTQLTNAASAVTNRTSSLNTMVSNSASADLVQTMVQLNQSQTAYQAALQTGAKIMSLSLLNYIQ